MVVSEMAQVRGKVLVSEMAQVRGEVVVTWNALAYEIYVMHPTNQRTTDLLAHKETHTLGLSCMTNMQWSH